MEENNPFTKFEYQISRNNDENGLIEIGIIIGTFTFVGVADDILDITDNSIKFSSINDFKTILDIKCSLNNLIKIDIITDLGIFVIEQYVTLVIINQFKLFLNKLANLRHLKND